MKISDGYFSSATCLISYLPDDKIRLKQAVFEDALRELTNAQSVNANVLDDAPVQIPRIVIVSGHKQVLISQVNAQLTLNFEKGQMTHDQQLATILKNCRMFWNAVRKVKSNDCREQGIMLTLSMPTDLTQLEITAFLKNHFLAPQFDQSLSAFGLRFGWTTENGLFKNLSFDAYETRAIDIKMQQTRQLIPLYSIPVTETGIEVKLDTNDKPTYRNTSEVSHNNAENLLVAIKELCTVDVLKIMNWSA